MFGGHVEVAGFRGMVGGLLGDVVAFRVIGEFPVAGERLAEDWVEWFLDTPKSQVSFTSLS
jgi:hypothetical protein